MTTEEIKAKRTELKKKLKAIQKRVPMGQGDGFNNDRAAAEIYYELNGLEEMAKENLKAIAARLAPINKQFGFHQP